MPDTRQASRKRARQSAILPTSESDEEAQEVRKQSSPGKQKAQAPSDDEIEDHLIQLQSAILKVKRETRRLREENANLKKELAAKQAPSQQLASSSQTRSRRSSRRNSDDTNLAEMRITSLQKTVKELKAENRWKQKRIDKLKANQVEDEVKNLQDVNGKESEAELDKLSRMRKLLRRFSDLMHATTIQADFSEECPICFEKFALEKCSALSCGHMLCHDCLPKVSKGADETVKCPECREFCPRNDLELVHLTEDDRWDALLKIAQAWCAFDRRGELETSEEEAEENFLTDGNGTSEGTSEGDGGTSHTQESASQAEAADIDEEDGSHPFSAPPLLHRQSFSQSPAKIKRKMLVDLAEERAKKRKK